MKNSFEKFAAHKIQPNHLKQLKGGDAEATPGGSVQLDNFIMEDGPVYPTCTSSWSSDSVGAGGGITYNDDTLVCGG